MKTGKETARILVEVSVDPPLLWTGRGVRQREQAWSPQRTHPHLPSQALGGSPTPTGPVNYGEPANNYFFKSHGIQADVTPIYSSFQTLGDKLCFSTRRAQGLLREMKGHS